MLKRRFGRKPLLNFLFNLLLNTPAKSLFHLNVFLFSLDFTQLSSKHSLICNSIHLGYEKRG
jgi:hypothetical protein